MMSIPRLFQLLRRRNRARHLMPVVHNMTPQRKARHYLSLARTLWAEGREELVPGALRTALEFRLHGLAERNFTFSQKPGAITINTFKLSDAGSIDVKTRGRLTLVGKKLSGAIHGTAMPFEQIERLLREVGQFINRPSLCRSEAKAAKRAAGEESERVEAAGGTLKPA